MNRYQRFAFVLAAGWMVTVAATSARAEWWHGVQNVVVISDQAVVQDDKVPVETPEGYIVGGCGDPVTKSCSGWWAGYCRDKHYSCVNRFSVWNKCHPCSHDKGCDVQPACGHKPHGCGHELGCGHHAHACKGCGFHTRKHVRGWRGCGCEVTPHGCGCGGKGEWAPAGGEPEAAGSAEPTPVPPTPEPETGDKAA
jgi:hypothetical protein